MPHLKLVFLISICLAGFYQVAEARNETFTNLCAKNNFQSFFKAYAEFPASKQLEYVEFPLMVNTVGDWEEGEPTTRKVDQSYFGSYKLILSPAELKKINADSKRPDRYFYQINKRGRDYEATLAIEGSTYLHSLLLRWEKDCWRGVEQENNESGL